MISEFVMNIVFNFVSGIFSLLPDIHWSIDTTFFDYWSDIVSVVTYMLPMAAVASIINTIIALTIFRIVIAFLKTVWDVLPIV